MILMALGGLNERKEVMQLSTHFGPIAILDLLEFLFDDGRCCFFLVVIVVVIIAILASRAKAATDKPCSECGHGNERDARFCSKCGDPLGTAKTPKSFYPNLKLRIANWKKWGWVSEDAHQRLQELNEADELVFLGRKPETLSYMVSQSGVAPSQAPVEPIDDEGTTKTADASSTVSHTDTPAEDPVVEQENPVVKPSDSESSQTELMNPLVAKPVVPKPAAALPKPSLPRVKPKSSKPLSPSPKPTKSPVKPTISRPIDAAPSEPPIKEAKPVAVVPAPPPKPPRRLSDVLRAFMDETNIKLGEFVAGLLIVIGSIGLVTALNATFKDEIPYLSSVVFLTVVTLFHVVGIYSFKKWNLVSSSRVILIIGNLLVPLNVLMTTMGNTSIQNNGIVFILAVLIAGLSFGSMSFYSAKLLSPRRPWPLIIALMGPCLCQLIIKLYVTGAGFEPEVFNTNALILLPLAFISFAILSEHRYFRKTKDVSPDDAFSLLRILGIGIFSLGACIALLFSRIETQQGAIDLSQTLSNPLMILCFIVVSSGMLIYRRIDSDVSLKLQMAGMWMAVTGTMGIVIMMMLAVPHLNSMITVSFVGAVLALIFGYVTRITFLTAAGTLCIGLGIWSLYLRGHYEKDALEIVELRDSLINGMTSIIFTITALLTGGLHYIFERVENRERPEFSKAGYLGVLLLAGVGLLSAFGSNLPFFTSENSDLTLAVFLIYAVAALIASLFTSKKLVHYVATGLVIVTSLKLANADFVESWGWLPEENWLGRLTVMGWAFLTAYVLTVIAQWTQQKSRAEKLAKSGQLISDFESSWPLTMTTLSYFVVTALNFFYIYLEQQSYQVAVGQSLLLLGVAVILAIRHRTDWTWMFVQIQTICAIACMTTMIHTGWAEDKFEFWGWGHLRWQMIVLAVGMLGWTAVRKVSQQSQHLKDIVVTDLMYVDFFLHALATMIVYVIWVIMLVSPLQSVYKNSAFLESALQFYGSSSVSQPQDWILWALNLLAWICVIPDRHRRISSFCGLLTLSALPILASTNLAYDSANEINGMDLIHYLKWGYGIFGVIVTSLVCTDRYWWRALEDRFPRLMANQDQKSAGDHAEYTWMALRIVSFIAASLPVVILTAAHFAYTSSVSGIGKEDNLTVLLQSEQNTLAAMWNFGGPFFLLVISAWICAVRSLRPLYLMAAFPMWVLGWMFFSLVPLWTDGADLNFPTAFESVKWALIGLGIYGFAWSAAGLKADGQRRQQLFQTSTASNFVYFITACGVCLYALVVNLDAFVVIEEVRSAAEWEGWRLAFANPSAFVCVVLLPAVCWMFNCVSNGDRGVSFVLIGTVALNATIAHLAVSGASSPGTSVLFFQTIGWIVAMFACVVSFATCLKLGKFKADSEESHWLTVRRVQGRWVGWISALAFISYIAFAIFWLEPASSYIITFDDGFLLSMMGLVILLYLIFASLTQDGVSIFISLLLTTPFVILVGFKLSSFDIADASGLIESIPAIIEQENLSIIRIVIAGFAVYAIISSLLHSVCQRFVGLVAHPDQLFTKTIRGLVSVCVTLFTLHSIIAVIKVPDSSEFQWIQFPLEWGIIPAVLIAIGLSGRDSRFDGVVPLLYTMGIGVVATFLTAWYPVEEDLNRQIHFFYVWIAFSAYLAIWGLIYRFEAISITVLRVLGLSYADKLLEVNRQLVARLQFWFGLVVSAVALLSTFYLSGSEEVTNYRYLASIAPLLVIIGLESLRNTSLGRYRQQFTLHLPLVSLAILLWAGISSQDPVSIESWYHRSARMFIAFAILGSLSYITFRKINIPLWKASVEQWLANLAGIAFVSISLSLVIETGIYHFSPEALLNLITRTELVGISIGLVCAVLTLAYIGLRPDFDQSSRNFRLVRPMMAFLSMIFLSVLFGHLEMASSTDGVRFAQMLGWLGLLVSSLVWLTLIVKRQIVVRVDENKQWTSLANIGGIWILWMSFLSAILVAGCLYFFGQSPAEVWFQSYLLHWFILSLVVFLYLLFSSIQQDSLTSGLAVVQFSVWAIISVFMVQGAFTESGDVYEAISRLSDSSYVYLRMIFASYSVLALLRLVSVPMSQVITGLPRQQNSIMSRSARWLANFSVTGLLGVSLVAMLGSVGGGATVWVEAQYEWAVLLLPLSAMYCCARYISSERSSTLSIYAYGSTLVITLLTVCFETANHNTDKFVFFICLAIALYLAVWGAIYRWQETVVKGLAKIGIRDAGQWMSASRHVIAGLQVSLGLILLACSFLSTFYLSNETGIEIYRYLSALLPLLVVVGLEVLRETPLSIVRRHVVLNAPFVAGIVLLWANLESGLIDANHWYQRIGRVFILTSVLAVSFVFRLSNLSERSEWFEPFRRIRINTTATALVTLFVTLVIEAYLRLQGDTASKFDPVAYEVIGIAVGIIAITITLLTVGLNPNLSPVKQTSLKVQQAYVYVAEILILVFFGHVWLGKPDWFGALGEYWPLVLMLLAFVGVFISEVFRKRENHVLSEPLHNTAFLLPMIPILTLWIFPSEGGGFFNSYPAIFFGAALLNVLMACLRRSFLHSVIAAVAGNASLWMFFTSTDSFSFADDPQFWVIPPAISMIIVAQIFKEKLTKKQISLIRYMCLTLIYLTASFQMIADWASSDGHITQMLLLGAFSLIGIGCGAVFKIPQFIYLGMIFLVMTLVSMVISGVGAVDEDFKKIVMFLTVILVGVLILLVIILRDKFEKQLKGWIERMDSWE